MKNYFDNCRILSFRYVLSQMSTSTYFLKDDSSSCQKFADMYEIFQS